MLKNGTLGIAELDHMHRRLGMRIAGVIAWAILSQYVVSIDYDRMQIELYDARNPTHGFDGQGFDLDVQGTVIFADAAVSLQSGDKFTGKVMVDTGSGGTFTFNAPSPRQTRCRPRSAGTMNEISRA